MSQLKITLKRSPIGHNETQKRTVRALGLRRLNQTVIQPDNPSIRGMIARIPHLLQVEVIQETAQPKRSRRTRKTISQEEVTA
jgi:large subunit ribosomal protein L30